jgi:hypothetical protein
MAYKCRAYPDEACQQVQARTFGCVRVVWNRTLADRHRLYHAEGKSLSYAASDAALTVILSEMIKGGDDVQALAGAMRSEASVTFLLSTPEVQYTLAIEPLRADPTYVYVDLDAQYPGAVDLTAVEGKIKSVDEFMRNQVNNFLDKRAEAWGR